MSDVSWLQMAHTHVSRQEGWLYVCCQEGKGRAIRLLHKAHRALYTYLQATHEILERITEVASTA